MGLFLAACGDPKVIVVRTENCVVAKLGPMKIRGATAFRSPYGGDELEFRIRPDKPNSYLVASVSPSVNDSIPGTYSVEKFTFELADPQHIRRASDADWESAKPLSLHQRPVKGKFPRAGTHWLYWQALASPSGRWIALQSFTPGPEPLLRIELPASRDKPPIDGKFFVEVFDSGLAHRVASIDLDVMSRDFGALSDTTGWITDSHLIIAGTHVKLENFAVCNCERGK